MKRQITLAVLNAAISLMLRIEARARVWRANLEACKTRRIGGHCIEVTPGLMEVRGSVRGTFIPAGGELPAGFYGRGPVGPDRSKNFRELMPDPLEHFQRSNNSKRT
jgi:hypothetical protein